MSDQSLNAVVARLQHLAAADGSDTVPDNELLRRYSSQRDSAALELVIWRYGAMVLATCRRLLGSGPDAEDAFQATFLVLIQKARSVRKR
jgi:DNA-directed RNA polymerase specialized sigma24 family protein